MALGHALVNVSYTVHPTDRGGGEGEVVAVALCKVAWKLELNPRFPGTGAKVLPTGLPH